MTEIPCQAADGRLPSGKYYPVPSCKGTVEDCLKPGPFVSLLGLDNVLITLNMLLSCYELISTSTNLRKVLLRRRLPHLLVLNCTAWPCSTIIRENRHDRKGDASQSVS